MSDSLMQTNWNGPGWAITVGDTHIELHLNAETRSYTPEQASEVRVRRGFFRWHLLDNSSRPARLRRLGRSDAAHLELALRRFSLSSRIARAVRWHRESDRVLTTALYDQRWISREQSEAILTARPPVGLLAELHASGVEPLLDDIERAAASMLDIDLSELVNSHNDQILSAELLDRRDLFDRIEQSPLTEEQARAVVCFDNRIHVLAAAGSGKTSVMVARAAYAIQRGFVQPDRVLLLAFNKSAAAELQERIETRLTAAGIPTNGVRAATFHSFGLDVIGKATRKKPRLADWLGAGQDVEMVLRIVDELRDRDPAFRYRWDLYRLMFASAPSEPDEGTPDGWDGAAGLTGYRTFNGEVVKSAGERMIADWLYLNGVEYQYERPYDVDVADEIHSQYQPDFYYPDIKAWHEHWAVGRDGVPPAEFVGYAEGMEWKRRLHAEHGSTLIQTTWADVMFGDGLSHLAHELESRGISLDWNPDRPKQGPRVLEHVDLARLVRTFMCHIKSNSLTPGSVTNRLTIDHPKLLGFRTQLFLDLYWPIHEEWNRRLRGTNTVDFEDMLVLAAEHLETGDIDMGYDLIMVDEFQDASQARARLTAGLLQKPGKFFVAVGDDWQSINRFAGADLSIMLDFEHWFGAGPTLRLSTTFRCPQSICDVASKFVTANPRQFRKSVTASRPSTERAVTLVRAGNTNDAVASYLERLNEEIATDDRIGRNQKASVNILGRYRFQQELVPRSEFRNLDISFRTVHGSKGLEADYVVVPGLISGTYGFPSAIADSPVLNLAMAAKDDYPHAEERRLLYVAMTRARQHTTLITEADHESAFAVELMNQYPEMVVNDDGTTHVPVVLCEKCRKGSMVQRSGKYGAFLGCSTFPACRNTQNIESA